MLVIGFLLAIALIFSFIFVWLSVHKFIFFSNHFERFLLFWVRFLSWLFVPFIFRILTAAFFIGTFHLFNRFCCVGHSCKPFLSWLVRSLIFFFRFGVCFIVWWFFLLFFFVTRCSKCFMRRTRLLPLFFWFFRFLFWRLIITKFIIEFIIFFRVSFLLWSTFSSRGL